MLLVRRSRRGGTPSSDPRPLQLGTLYTLALRGQISTSGVSRA